MSDGSDLLTGATARRRDLLHRATVQGCCGTGRFYASDSGFASLACRLVAKRPYRMAAGDMGRAVCARVGGGPGGQWGRWRATVPTEEG